MSKRTLFLIFSLFVITSALLALALYNPNSQPKTTQVTPTPKVEIAQTSLSFGSPVIATSSSIVLNYSLPINIATGNNKVTAVQLELQYDPEVLTNVSVNPGSFFASPQVLLEQIDQKTGRVTYAFGAGLSDPAVMGQGTVATLEFSTSLDAVETTITFLPKTLVTAEDIVQSVLKETFPIKLVVGKTNSTPSSNLNQ